MVETVHSVMNKEGDNEILKRRAATPKEVKSPPTVEDSSDEETDKTV